MADLFTTDVPIWEIVLRGTVMFFIVFVVLRIMLRRSAGQVNTLDFVFVLLIANSATNGLSGGYSSITDGALLTLTIAAWNYALNALSFAVPVVQRMISPGPLRIVENGRLLRQNMRREFLSRRELDEELREQGIEDIAQVKAAYIEADGTISVIRANSSDAPRRSSGIPGVSPGPGSG
jgi:uncharacterized membrane protein YcaP (DUF421 family)